MDSIMFEDDTPVFEFPATPSDITFSPLTLDQQTELTDTINDNSDSTVEYTSLPLDNVIISHDNEFQTIVTNDSDNDCWE